MELLKLEVFLCFELFMLDFVANNKTGTIPISIGNLQEDSRNSCFISPTLWLQPQQSGSLVPLTTAKPDNEENFIFFSQKRKAPMDIKLFYDFTIAFTAGMAVRSPSMDIGWKMER